MIKSILIEYILPTVAALVASAISAMIIRVLVKLGTKIKDARIRALYEEWVKAAEQKYNAKGMGAEKFKWVSELAKGKFPKATTSNIKANIEAATFSVSAMVKKALEYKTEGMLKNVSGKDREIVQAASKSIGEKLKAIFKKIFSKSKKKKEQATKQLAKPINVNK